MTDFLEKVAEMSGSDTSMINSLVDARILAGIIDLLIKKNVVEKAEILNMSESQHHLIMQSIAGKSECPQGVDPEQYRESIERATMAINARFDDFIDHVTYLNP